MSESRNRTKREKRKAREAARRRRRIRNGITVTAILLIIGVTVFLLAYQSESREKRSDTEVALNENQDGGQQVQVVSEDFAGKSEPEALQTPEPEDAGEEAGASGQETVSADLAGGGDGTETVSGNSEVGENVSANSVEAGDGDPDGEETVSGNLVWTAVVSGNSVTVSGNLTAQDREMMELLREVSDEEVKAYFDKAVFAGDSLMEGYRNYALTDSESWANQSDFLAVKSFSLVYALKPVSEGKLQPSFQGKKYNIWDAVKIMDVDRVFLMFGANDLVGRRPEYIYPDYQALISNIREKNPEVEIHVISMTPSYKGASKGALNRDGVQALNQLLLDGAEENGYSYVDVYSLLADEDGYLPAKLCSDRLVHQTREAYKNGWDQVLHDHAVFMLQDEEARKYIIEKRKAEEERLEQERLEQERLEQERLEQERLEQEKAEQEKLEQEETEGEQLEPEKAEQEEAEQGQPEQEKTE